jgi:crossover junction endodeoxyribonuclease RusA
VKLTLPLPPSGNHRNGLDTRGAKPHFFATRETKAFRQYVALALKAAGVRPTSGPVSVELDVYPNREGRDLDNVEKTLWDALEGLAYDNDKRIRRKRVEMHPADRVPRVELSIEPYPEASDDPVLQRADELERALLERAKPPPLPRIVVGTWRPPSKRGGKP